MKLISTPKLQQKQLEKKMCVSFDTRPEFTPLRMLSDLKNIYLYLARKIRCAVKRYSQGRSPLYCFTRFHFLYHGPYIVS